MKKKYDYLIVGAGLFGSVFACEATKRGKTCLVIDRRSNVGGNCACKEVEGIQVHQYGAHIFHTDSKPIWDYVNAVAEFNDYVNSPVANYKGKLYNLPFNMNTFYALWGTVTPQQAKDEIDRQVAAEKIERPRNLEEKALSLVGRDIYEKLVKGYTEKQWGRKATELPAFIIGRLPVRFTFDNNYFNDRYQGIPVGGYNVIFEKLLAGIEVRLNADYFQDRPSWNALADKIIFTGAIDAYYDYCYGELEYRSLRFESQVQDTENYQGNAVVNYTDAETPFTRIIEHKHFEKKYTKKTVITREYPAPWKRGDEPYYTVNDDRNNRLYEKYAAKAEGEKNTVFAGRLGDYKYYDMHHIVAKALDLARKEFGSER